MITKADEADYIHIIRAVQNKKHPTDFQTLGVRI